MSISLWTEEAACFDVELFILRAGGEEEEVPRATQVWRLSDGYVLIRALLPTPRCKYELRLLASSVGSPSVLRRLPLTYTITSGDQCQTLLSSLYDTLVPKFGFAQMTPATQLYGVVVFAPTAHRVEVGQCYFLVHVVADVALARARAEVPPSATGASSASASLAPLAPAARAVGAGKLKEVVTTSSLFEVRLAEVKAEAKAEPTSKAAKAEKPRRSFFAHESQAMEDVAPAPAPAAPKAPVAETFFGRVRKSIEPRCQDGDGELHLDVTMHDGECVHRLHERRDFPGFYEGIFEVGEQDVNHAIHLSIRFPRAHASEHSPKSLGRWVVHRHEHLPLHF